MHGEARHLHLHARLAQALGMPAENVFILNNGAAWTTDGTKAWLEAPVAARNVLVDGRLVGEVEAIVMRDRQRLSHDGFIVALIPVDGRNKLAGEPEIISRGFVPVDGSNALLQAARHEIKRHYEQGRGVGAEALREMLQDFFYRKTQSRPVVLPSFIRV